MHSAFGTGIVFAWQHFSHDYPYDFMDVQRVALLQKMWLLIFKTKSYFSSRKWFLNVAINKEHIKSHFVALSTNSLKVESKVNTL